MSEQPPTDLEQILETRWSCRAFLDKDVPREVVDDVFALAQRTASWCNTQPWQVYIVSGEATKRFADGLTAYAQTHSPATDLPAPAAYVGVYRDRRREAGFKLYESLGITRDDADLRDAQRLRNFAFFGAPHVAVITTDANQGVYGAVDCGGYVANVLNAATSLGVATIPQAAIAMQSPYVREFLDLPVDRLVVCAISFGYADLAHPANGFRTSRALVSDAVTHVN